MGTHQSQQTLLLLVLRRTNRKFQFSLAKINSHSGGKDCYKQPDNRSRTTHTCIAITRCSQSCTHSRTHSLTHALMHSCTHSLTHARTQAITHALTHSLRLRLLHTARQPKQHEKFRFKNHFSLRAYTVTDSQPTQAELLVHTSQSHDDAP